MRQIIIVILALISGYGCVATRAILQNSKPGLTREVIEHFSEGSEKVITYYCLEGDIIAKESVSKNGVVTLLGKIPDGKVMDYFENGRVEREFTFKDNKENGLYKGYYSDGRISEEAEFKDGKQEGFYRLYYDDGNVEMEGYFTDYKKNGLIKAYDRKGVLEDESFYKEDQRDGLSKKYSSSGELVEHGMFKEGKLYEHTICNGQELIEYRKRPR